MRRARFRFPMFWKFLVGCLLLAAFLIIGGTYVIANETRLRNRGNYLAKSVRRLHGYIENVGRGMTGLVELISQDTELRAALDTVGDADTQARRIYDGMMQKNGLQPDVFVLVSPRNEMLWAPEKSLISEADLPEMASVEKARNGSVFAHRIQLVGGQLYQVSAVPVKKLGGDVITAVLLVGVRLQRYYDDWSTQSDEDPVMRMRPLLVDGLTVYSSAWSRERDNELARALQPEKQFKVRVGDDVRDVIKVGNELFDFYGENEEGYKGGDAGVVGKLYMTRSRANVVDPAASLPWKEIGAGIGASVLIALLLGYWVTRPIKQMVRQSRDLLAGDTDLTQRIVVSSSDETAALADNINQVFARVHVLATGVQTAAFQVGASSAEISAASRQMLTGLKDQTLKVESSTTAVTELSASIQTVAGNAARATDVAEQSSHAVTDAVLRMEQIRAAVDDAAQKMRDLGESSKRIGNIVEVIRQISEQTSMLALNASIEAAHAGEQGRGFAVVADEVSSLARRVGQSAKDIEALIQTVKEQTQAAIQSMEVGTREVVSGSQLVTSTLTGLGQLITVVKDTASAVHEQAVVSDEIARNMDAVRHLAGEALHGSEESVVQAERLHELAYELEESIGGFNLDGTKIGSSRPREVASTGSGAARQLPPGTKRKPIAKPPRHDDGAGG
jgi:methyl-accepting chemotaxis protein